MDDRPSLRRVRPLQLPSSRHLHTIRVRPFHLHHRRRRFQHGRHPRLRQFLRTIVAVIAVA
jgi:hypothetical protein